MGVHRALENAKTVNAVSCNLSMTLRKVHNCAGSDSIKVKEVVASSKVAG